MFDPTMDFEMFQMLKPDIWTYGTNKFTRIINPDTATRKERAQVMDYWASYQKCNTLFGEQIGVFPHRESSHDWKPLVKQAEGCMASAWSRLAADIGDEKATLYLEAEWGQILPDNIIKAGILQKAKFAHLS